MIYYLRDSNSKLIGLKYNDNLYYYLKNAQDDIIGLLDSNYNLVAEYLYDSWGNVISIKDNLGNEIIDTSNIAYINPFRYRSYYYDSETKLYYLNSRYYNPAWGRFINADGIINASELINDFNLYAYTVNNPIKYQDDTGSLLDAAAVIFGGEIFAIAALGILAYFAGRELTQVIVNEATKPNNSKKKKKDDEEEKKEETYAVYRLIDTTGKTVYVGRTNNIKRREQEHKRSKSRQLYKMIPIEENLSYEDSRVLEEISIRYYKTLNTSDVGCNRRHGLSEYHPLYKENIQLFSGETYVGGCTQWDYY